MTNSKTRKTSTSTNTTKTKAQKIAQQIRERRKQIRRLQEKIRHLQAAAHKEYIVQMEVKAELDNKLCGVFLADDNRRKPVFCGRPAWRTGFAKFLRYSLPVDALMCPHHADLTEFQIKAELRSYHAVSGKTRAEILAVRDKLLRMGQAA